MNARGVVVLALTAITAGVSFLMPKPRYESLNVLDELSIPVAFADWRSIDVSGDLNLKDDRYNFISDVFARLYQNSFGEQLLFLILDAGNFHNPKVCYTSSGFEVEDLETSDFRAGSRTFQPRALQMDREGSDMSLFYWLVIDKEIVGWTGQKIKELWASMRNKKKAGLMVRLEIPEQGRNPRQNIALAREFVRTLNESLSEKDRSYLFGE